MDKDSYISLTKFSYYIYKFHNDYSFITEGAPAFAFVAQLLPLSLPLHCHKSTEYTYLY